MSSDQCGASNREEGVATPESRSRAEANKGLAIQQSGRIFVHLSVAHWFFTLTLIPIATSLVLGFTDYDILSAAPQWVGLRNFEKMFFDDPRYWRSVRATVYFVFASVPLKLIFALIVAMLLNSARRFISIYRAVYYAPSVVGGSIAVAVMWREIFGGQGLLNAILAVFGIPDRAWLGDPETAIWTLILLAIWQFGSPMLIFLAGLKLKFRVPNGLNPS